VSFIVIECDLQPVDFGNVLIRFADDSYVVVRATNLDAGTSELMLMQTLAEDSNLKLSFLKSKEN